MMKVPFLDLKAQYLSMKDEIHAAIQAVLDATAFAGGPFVAQFEKEFASFCGCREGVGVGSGTEAMFPGLTAKQQTQVVTKIQEFLAKC